MTLRRLEIRQEVARRLVAAGTMFGDRISTNRARRIWRSGLPAAVIYARRESVGITGEAPRELERRLELAVELFLEDPEKQNLGPPDDLIDQACQEIEDVLLPDPILRQPDGGNLCHDASALQEVEIAFSAMGAALDGSARITFAYVYHEQVDELEPWELPAFERARVVVDLPPPDGIPESEDELELIQP